MEKDTKQLIKDYIFGETITEISLRQGVNRKNGCLIRGRR